MITQIAFDRSALCSLKKVTIGDNRLHIPGVNRFGCGVHVGQFRGAMHIQVAIPPVNFWVKI